MIMLVSILFDLRWRNGLSYVHYTDMSNQQTTIPCMVLRGGTSRGVYFLADDLPSDTRRRDAVLLSVIGGPDELQIDGIGGGHPLTNKVAIIKRSQRQGVDIDYLFLQVMPGEGRVADVQNCGNILAGVGAFAIEAGMVAAEQEYTTVRVFMVNSGGSAELLVQTPAGEVC
jgi:4-oxalomesaconate tautomerase